MRNFSPKHKSGVAAKLLLHRHCGRQNETRKPFSCQETKHVNPFPSPFFTVMKLFSSFRSSPFFAFFRFENLIHYKCEAVPLVSHPWLCLENLLQLGFRVRVKLSWSSKPWLTAAEHQESETIRLESNLWMHKSRNHWIPACKDLKKCSACQPCGKSKQPTTYKQSNRVTSLFASNIYTPKVVP